MLARIGKSIKRARAFVERRDVYIVLIVIFVSVASFGLGKLSYKPEEHESVRIENVFENTSLNNIIEVVGEDNVTAQPPVASVTTVGSFVGSKNSDKYHFPWCSGALRIKEENKVWFSSREEAEMAGYTPAANCKGL